MVFTFMRKTRSGKCSTCGESIAAGDDRFWDSEYKRVACVNCCQEDPVKGFNAGKQSESIDKRLSEIESTLVTISGTSTGQATTLPEGIDRLPSEVAALRKEVTALMQRCDNLSKFVRLKVLGNPDAPLPDDDTPIKVVVSPTDF